jgi:hypothetical protein
MPGNLGKNRIVAQKKSHPRKQVAAAFRKQGNVEEKTQ